jgi:colanic acid biosynthesis glycosyl transferase WcaI
MRVLIIYRHYWPDAPPLGDILKTLAEHLSARGHKVTVFTGYPDRKAARTTLPPREFKGGVRIVRARGPAGGGIVRRVVSEALFLAQAFAYAARHRFDLVWTDSLPPIVNGVVGIMAARASGARFLYHVHSVHPEALAITGLVTTPFVLRAWSRIDSWTCRRADAVVVLSEDMMRTIADRGGNGAVAFNVMRSFVLTPPAPSSGRTNPTPQPYRLAIYGSFGRGQDIDRLIAAMALIRPDEGIELEIIRMAGRQRDEDRRADELNLPHVRSTGTNPRGSAAAAARGRCRRDRVAARNLPRRPSIEADGLSRGRIARACHGRD